MNDASPGPAAGARLQALNEIDLCCDAFERAWRSGQRPRLEEHLAQAPPALQAQLFAELLALDSRVTDCNSAFFDVANDFHGCIAGCHDILRRQGLLEGIWCLDPHEGLSPGQKEEIDRVSRMHADLSDDGFVAANLERWLG